MLKLLKADIVYSFKSKLFMGMLLVFTLFTCLTYFLSYNHAMIAYSDYTHQIEYLEQNNMDLDEELQKEYEILHQDASSGVIKNPTSYYYETFVNSMYSLEPGYAISQFLEQAFVFFPIIASFFGVIWSAVDIKNKTLRNRCLRFGKQKCLFGRQLSGFVLLCLMLIISSCVVFIIQAITKSIFVSAIGKSYQLQNIVATSFGKYILQYAIGIASILFYYEIGFAFGYLFKGSNLILILICIYMLLIPPLFKYDIANIFNNIGVKIFEFNGPITITKAFDINYCIGAMVLLGIFFTLNFIVYFVNKRKSAYI